MKDLITDAITQKLATTLEAVGGARALYGDPIAFNGETIVPVARVTVRLAANAEGGGSGNAGIGGALAQKALGGGSGSAGAGIDVRIEPVGFLRSSAQGPVFVALEAGA